MSEASNQSINPEGQELQKVLKSAERVQAAKRYGMMFLGVVGQIALGAAGGALYTKIRDRKAANNNGQQQVA